MSMSMSTTITASATELIAAIADGDISSEEVVEQHLRRVEEINGSLNAVVVLRADEARQEARAADRARSSGEPCGVLHGLPVTIKDQFDVAGLPTTFGVSRLQSRVLEQDGPMVAAWRAAGAIVMAKTNVPQGLGLYETTNDLVGRTNNPWDLNRTPGGSSGGDAALIAAGAAPLGLGADFGGSLRVPAAWCGLSTLKPTARRLPIDGAPVRTGSGGEGIVAQPGPLARTVADVTLGMKVMVDSLTEQRLTTNPPVPWRDPKRVDPAGLRIALLPEIDHYRPAPAVRRALAEAAEALQAAGATVEPWSDAPDTTEGAELMLRLFSADGFAFSRHVIGDDKPHPLVARDLQVMALPAFVLRLLTTGLSLAGQKSTARLMKNLRPTSAEGLMDLLGQRRQYEAAFLAAMEAHDFDLVLCPALPLPAPPHNLTARLPDAFASATLFNLLGFPAGVTPVTRVRPGEESDRPTSSNDWQKAAIEAERDSAGLPVGVQLVARPWREDLVLAAMSAIETNVKMAADFPVTPIEPSGPVN